MFDTNHLSFDLDGDGAPDALNVDLDGDGMADGLGVDFDGDGHFDAVLVDSTGDGSPDMAYFDNDGDSFYETLAADTDANGIFDTFFSELDANGDGVTDYFSEMHDYDQDGILDSVKSYWDTDGNGSFDLFTNSYDSDGDTVIDTVTTHADTDGDGVADITMQEQLIDTDGNAVPDTYVVQVDPDGDGVFDILDVSAYDPATGGLVSLGAFELEPEAATMRYEGLENFDPATADPADVGGDPGASMEHWEYQGSTGRCTLYAQKFVIEELTGQELDIEQLADLAEANGWFTEESGGTTLNMNKVLDYYGVENEVSFNNSIDDIRECLENGGKVIVSVDADEIWFADDDSIFTPGEATNHAVEVIGIDYSDPDEPMVILNDSGTDNGCGEMVPLDVFVDAWEDGNCHMISCM